MLGQLLHPPNGGRGNLRAELSLARAHSYLGCFAAFYQKALGTFLPFHLAWFIKIPDDAISFLKEVIL